MKKVIILSVLSALNIASINAKKDCFSVELGYPCCTSTNEVVTIDDNGAWGIENDKWCGIEKKVKRQMNFPFFGGWNKNAVNNAAAPSFNAAAPGFNANTNNNGFGGGWSFNPWSWWSSGNNANTNPISPASNTIPTNNWNQNTNTNTNTNSWNQNTNANTNINSWNQNTNANTNNNSWNQNTNANTNNNSWNQNTNANTNNNSWNQNTNANKNTNVNTNKNNNNNNNNVNNTPKTNTNNNNNANNTPKPNTNNNNTNNNSNNNNASGGSVGKLPDVTGGKTGTTTGYWDCCVASCSWDGNVQGATPVKACHKDGVSLITEELWKVKSVCDNSGNAYMCNDQQPIVINSDLAYGFAASHEPCCTCQRLQFTSGPIKGKQMIVQVTNTGSDIGNNHFDLQIPGAGVGIFNGCSKQWGAPNDGWGRRYGGVTTLSECSQLPSQLRAGCEWRFGWFGSADNPGVVYERVQCPKQLTSITGCVLADDAQQKKVV